MKEIPLTQGKFALVDDEDYERLSQFKWYAHKHGRTFYARRNETTSNGKQRTIKMHGELLTGYKIVDHINGDGLDNRRENLRGCAHAENCRNQRKQVGRSSIYKGVTWNKRDRRWQAQITHLGMRKSLGYWASEISAAKAYDTAAIELFGPYARTNFNA